MKAFSWSLLALIAVVALTITLVTAQGDGHVITFTYPDSIQAGAKTNFNFTSTQDFAKDERIIAKWSNEDAEASRATNCLLVHRQTTYPNQLRQGLNFGHMYCYLPTQTQHFTLDSFPDGATKPADGELWVARMENDNNDQYSPDNCNNNNTENPRPVFSIKFIVGVPAGTQITCDFAAASNNLLPPRSNIVPQVTSTGDAVGTKWTLAQPVSVSVVPTKAWIMSSRPHPKDPYAFLVTMNSTRPGLVEMSTIVNTFTNAQRTQFGFVNHYYSSGTDGSFWCFGTEKKRRNDRIARVVPPQESRRLTVSSIGIYFEEANVPAECVLKIRPLQMGVQMTDPRIYLRLHQQPLHYVFNATHDHFRFNVSHTFNRLAEGYNDQNNNHRDLKSWNPALGPNDGNQGSMVPQAIIQFPIEPGYAKGSLFFLKLSALEGTTVDPQAFLALVTLAIDSGINADITPSVSVDVADESRIKITYNGDVSAAVQLMGLSLTLKAPAAEPTRYRYQIDVLNSEGTLLNIFDDQKLELDMLSQMQVHTATYTLKANEIDVITTFAPNWNSVGAGSMVRITSRGGNWFNGTETCTAERAAGAIKANTIKRKGDIYVVLQDQLIQNEIVTVNCAITSPTPFLWEVGNTGTKEERYIILEVGVIPPKFVLPLDYHSGLNPGYPKFYSQYNRFVMWPGSVILTRRDTVVTIVAPPAFEMLGDEDSVLAFDPLQDDSQPTPTREDPQGWAFTDNGYTIASSLPWTSTSSIEDLRPFVEKVAKVLATVQNSTGTLPYSNISFDNLYYQSWNDWGNRRVPDQEILGTIQDTQSPYEYTNNNYVISWSFRRPDGEDVSAKLEAALKTAVEDGTLDKTDAWLTDSRYLNGTPISESCKGPRAFGRPGCVLKLQNMPCQNNAECNSYICNDDKVCATISRTYTWHQWTRPESLGQYSPSQFNYLTSNAVMQSAVAVVAMVAAVALMF